MAAAGSVRRVIRALTKHRAMQAATEAALPPGALLLDVQAARLAVETFTQEIEALPPEDRRFVARYLEQEKAVQHATWAWLHGRMSGRHGGDVMWC